MIRCRVTDFVEPDLNWEAESYESTGVDFKAFQLRNADAAQLVRELSDAQVLVVDQAKITRAVLEGLPEVKLIIRHGDGYDNVDVAAATELGIAVANKPGFWSEEVADQALVLALAAVRKIGVQRIIAARTGQTADSLWNLKAAFPLARLRALTVGVIGFGKIGRHFAAKTAALGMKVVVHDAMIEARVIQEAGYSAVSFEELLAVSDIVSPHVPATPQTTGLFTAQTLAMMKPTAILVNSSRGAVVVTDDLVAALRNGVIAGAALDATSPEPLPQDHPLLSMPNVIVTPHLGWYSEDAMWEMRRSIVEDVIALGSGKLPVSVVNPDVLKRENSRNKAGA